MMDNIEKFQVIKKINNIKMKLNRAEVEEIFTLSEQNENRFHKMEQFVRFGQVGYRIYKNLFKILKHKKV